MFITSKNIKYLRESAGLSQEEFAEEFGLNRGNVSSYEAGSLPKDPAMLVRIAAYFKVDLQKFLAADLSKDEEVKILPIKKDKPRPYLEDRMSDLEEQMKEIWLAIGVNRKLINKAKVESEQVTATEEVINERFDLYMRNFSKPKK